jgi:hypothetical protein
MTMRARIAASAGVSVALAVLAAALGLYLGVRSDLRGEIDRSLRERAHALAMPAPAGPPGRGGAGGGAGGGLAQGGAGDGPPPGPPPGDGDGGRGPGPGPGPNGFPANLPPAPFGAAQGYVQFISPQGALVVPGGQRSPARIAPSAADIAIARRGSGSSLSDRTDAGTRLRVLTLGTGARGAVMVARPLTEVNHELSTLLLLLAAIGAAGIALAVLLGALPRRAGAPRAELQCHA